MTNPTVSQLRSRGVALLLSAVAAVIGAVAACSYDETKGDILLHMTNVPPNATRAEVTLTTTNPGDQPKTYLPRFGAHNGTVDLAFAAPSTGTYSITIEVRAFDSPDAGQPESLVATGTVSGGPFTMPPPANSPVRLEVALSPVANDGTFAARCKADDAGVQSCNAGLACIQYQAGSRGVCTQGCTGAGAGTCPAAPSPQASCLTASQVDGGQFCQWQCDGGVAPGCPPGLFCPTGTGNRFCQPP
jgi:hypothetical protein